MKLFFTFFFISTFLSAQLPDLVVNNDWYLIDYDDGSNWGPNTFTNNSEFNEIRLNY